MSHGGVLHELPGESAVRRHALEHEAFLRLSPAGDEVGVLDLPVGIRVMNVCASTPMHWCLRVELRPPPALSLTSSLRRLSWKSWSTTLTFFEWSCTWGEVPTVRVPTVRSQATPGNCSKTSSQVEMCVVTFAGLVTTLRTFEILVPFLVQIVTTTHVNRILQRSQVGPAEGGVRVGSQTSRSGNSAAGTWYSAISTTTPPPAPPPVGLNLHSRCTSLSLLQACGWSDSPVHHHSRCVISHQYARLSISQSTSLSSPRPASVTTTLPENDETWQAVHANVQGLKPECWDLTWRAWYSRRQRRF